MRSVALLMLFVGCAFGQSFDPDPLKRLMLDVDIKAARPAKPLCTVGLDKSPMIRGKFRLGMSRADYDRPMPQSKPAGPALLDVSGPVPVRSIPPDIDLTPLFFEDKLIWLKADYRSGIEWDADAEFAYVIASEFDLPVAAWRENGRNGLVMFCDGWLMLAESNRIELRDESAIARMKKAQVAAERSAAEEKKKRFKP